MDLISIIIPCYNEESSLPLFYDKICETVSVIPADFEFIFVDDGSSDNTLEYLKSIALSDKRVKYISFSRNFGKEAAFYAGFEAAKGDYTAVMDADLQDPPEMLAEMYSTLKNEPYDCAAARRVTREGEPKIRSFFAGLFYKIINKISKTEIVDGARDFRLMTRRMKDAILSLKEYNRFSKGIFGWVGFKTKWLEYKNIERVAGQTKWSFFGLLIYSLDGIIAFSNVPAAIPAVCAGVSGLFALILSVISIIMAVSGKLSIFAALLIILASFSIFGIFMCLAVISGYLLKTYLESKQRPIYIIREHN